MNQHKHKFKAVVSEINNINYTINVLFSLRETPARKTFSIYKPHSRYQRQKIIIISDNDQHEFQPGVNVYPSNVIIFSGKCENAYMFIYKAGKEIYDILQESGQLTKNCITFGKQYPWVTEIMSVLIV